MTTLAVRLVVLSIVLVAVSGCYGASTRVIAPSATVPVSLSRAVRGPDGRVLHLNERNVVGQVHMHRTVYSIFYGAANFDSLSDVSEELNAQVAAASGQAVTNLAVRVDACAWGWIFPLNWLPFWPGCAEVDITGDIIQTVSPAPLVVPVTGGSVPVESPQQVGGLQ